MYKINKLQNPDITSFDINFLSPNTKNLPFPEVVVRSLENMEGKELTSWYCSGGDISNFIHCRDISKLADIGDFEFESPTGCQVTEVRQKKNFYSKLLQAWKTNGLLTRGKVLDRMVCPIHM